MKTGYIHYESWKVHLLATEEQSDSVICLKSHRKYMISLKMNASSEYLLLLGCCYLQRRGY